MSITKQSITQRQTEITQALEKLQGQLDDASLALAEGDDSAADTLEALDRQRRTLNAESLGLAQASRGLAQRQASEAEAERETAIRTGIKDAEKLRDQLATDMDGLTAALVKLSSARAAVLGTAGRLSQQLHQLEPQAAGTSSDVGEVRQAIFDTTIGFALHALGFDGIVIQGANLENKPTVQGLFSSRKRSQARICSSVIGRARASLPTEDKAASPWDRAIEAGSA